MMVVIVVSRRVGQVTLAVSERTSCRNLNGLKAIVVKIRVRRRTSFESVKETEQHLAAQPSSEGRAGVRARLFGDCLTAAPGIRKTGRLRVARYVLPVAQNVKLARHQASSRPKVDFRLFQGLG